MKLPNKVTTYNESVLSKFTAVLDVISEKDTSVLELYCETRKSFTDISEFIDTLDCLFALKQLEYSDESEVLYYVG